MNLIRLLPVLISLLLMAAHFYRAGIMILVICIPASALLLLVRAQWAVRVVQGILVLGGIEWIRTLVTLVMQRQDMGMPWIRLAVILGVVALVTASSALVFRLKSLRERYKSES
jgi:hypothetical protein